MMRNIQYIPVVILHKWYVFLF